MAENASAEIYRQTILGDILCDVLESFVENGKLNEAMAETIMKQFDMVTHLGYVTIYQDSMIIEWCMHAFFHQSFLEALHTNDMKATINADLKTYKFFDNVSANLMVQMMPPAHDASAHR